MLLFTELEPIAGYLARIYPALGMGLLCLWLAPKHSLLLRLFIYVLMFIVLRDVMTPLGWWHFGTEAVFWLRVSLSPLLLCLVGAVSIAIVALINFAEPDLSALIAYRKGGWLRTFGAGLLGAVLIAAPLLVLYTFVPVTVRGGQTPDDLSLMPTLLFFCLAANFYEETLFRGYFQGYMETVCSPLRAALLSGALFGMAHSFLAITVSNAGPGVLVFTLYEGIIAGLVRMRAGLLASTLAHGVGIFLLAGGFI